MNENSFYQKQFKFENERFARMTANFTIDNWRECRNENYWESDKIQNPLDRLRFKNLCIENYLLIKNALEK